MVFMKMNIVIKPIVSCFFSVVFVGEIKLLSLSGVILEWEDTLQNPNTERYNQVTVEVESAVSTMSF